MKTLYFGAVILISGLFIAAAAGPTVAEYHEKVQPPKLDINKATQRDIAIKINPILGKDVCHAITGDRRDGGLTRAWGSSPACKKSRRQMWRSSAIRSASIAETCIQGVWQPWSGR